MKQLFLGIDTSNYTTSASVVDIDGKIITDIRIPLKVPLGKKGLRQSDAVFQHICNLDKISEELENITNKTRAISCSITPRSSIDDSYMPVFKVGYGLGCLISKMSNIPFYMTSHQRGHIMNGVWTSGIKNDSFICIHFSGGTSDILIANNCTGEIKDRIIGNSLDIHAGQLVDRVGVYLGFDFPSGKMMEEIALEVEEDYSFTIPAFFRDGNISFSGAELKAKKLIDEGKNPALVSRGIFNCLAKSIEKCILYHCSQQNTKEVLLFGGVMCNSIIRKRLMKRMAPKGIKLYFCLPEYSSDNAVGVALIARNKYCNNNEGNFNEI